MSSSIQTVPSPLPSQSGAGRQSSPPADLDLDLAIDWAAARFEEDIARGDDPSVPYEPFLTAVRARSRGYSYRTPGIITGRNHDNLSRGEEGVLQLLDDPEENTNLREQKSIPPQLTWLLCLKRKWPHPFYKMEPAVLSVDFLVNQRRGGRLAIDFKMKKDLKQESTRRKLDIVGEALRLVGVPHKCMTEDDLPRIKVRNLRFLHHLALPFDPPPLTTLDLERVEGRVIEALRDGRTPIFDAAQQVAADSGIPTSRLCRGALWCIARRRWAVDMDRPIGPDRPVTFLK